MDGTLIGIITASQSRSGSNGTERVLHTPQNHQMQFCVIPRTPFGEGFFTLLQGMQSIYSKPCQQAELIMYGSRKSSLSKKKKFQKIVKIFWADEKKGSVYSKPSQQNECSVEKKIKQMIKLVVNYTFMEIVICQGLVWFLCLMAYQPL